jgi:small-conductance mechanosensitive channel
VSAVLHRVAGLALPFAIFAAGPAPSPTPPPAAAPAATEPAPIVPVDLPALPRTLEGGLERVGALQSLASPSAEAGRIEHELPRMTDEITKHESFLRTHGPDDVSYRDLDLLRIELLDHQSTLVGWEKSLERDAKALDDARRDLTNLDVVWRTTLARNPTEPLPPALSDKIGVLLEKTGALQGSLRARAASLLLLQDAVSSTRVRTSESLESVARLNAQVGDRLFQVENDPLWSVLASARPRLSLAGEALQSWQSSAAEVVKFLHRNKTRFWFQLALFGALAACGPFLVRWVRRDATADASAVAATEFLDRPVSAAATLALFASIWIYPPTAAPLHAAALTLMLAAYFRFVPKLVAPLRGPAYGFGWLFLLDRIHDFALEHSLLQRLVLLAVGVLGIVVWVWALRADAREHESTPSAWRTFWRVAVRVATAFLAIAVVANLVGNVSLAEELTTVSVKGAFMGAVFLIVSRILENLYVLLLRWLASHERARLVQRNAGLLERRGRKLIRLAALGIWLFFILWALRVIDQFGQWVAAVMRKQWAVGKVHIGLGGLVAFAAALTLGILAARMIRFVLDEAVFPRMTLPRGVPAAISTTAGYLVVTAGVVMAFLAAGLEMSQFTFLAGAFGVGIGFGLQNVVNNFVSGLILLYERPIQVGDVVAVGTLQGRVRRIGIRSSTVATFDGAEVIVPNATLIATDVVNWTLSDRLRRVDIAVGAGYGSDPRKVLEILGRVARSHEEVLASPEPTVLFVGFGDSSLNFELRVWTPEYDASVRVGSEMRTAIVAAFKDAGIEIPFPQRDVRVRSIDPGASGLIEKGPAG